MGEYAERAIAREIRERGQELALQHDRQSPAERRRADEAERKRQSEVWDVALAAAQARKSQLDQAGIIIALSKGKMVARQGAAVLGVWYPHKRGTIGKYGCPKMSAGQWVGRVFKMRRTA